MNEFSIIDHYFKQTVNCRNDVVLGVGDDAALTRVPHDQLLVTAVDTLLVDTHFFADTDSFDIAYKALAVNLSDLAAMGATPAWLTLALSMPAANEAWLTRFHDGLFSLINPYRMQLIGGDTVKGPLAVTIQVQGFVPENLALLRSQAKAGDIICVTGSLGAAAMAVQFKNKNLLLQKKLTAEAEKQIIARLNHPQPQIEAGLALRGLSKCAIDISDGLVADLGHLLNASHVGATLNLSALPIATILTQHCEKTVCWDLVLGGGDDYELCFTVAPENLSTVKQKFAEINIQLTCIGHIEQDLGLRLLSEDGQNYTPKNRGYSHF